MSDAHAERKPITDVCKGCVATVPEKADAAPLLVLLHGDNGNAGNMHRAWEKLAEPRGVALLSLACPTELGCANSFWQWDGDPVWINERITSLEKRHAIDRDRMWIAGWSGGASYMGYRTQELERTFAAMFFHGGGIPPASDACSTGKPPVIFLSGDQNPLQHLAFQLRDHYTRCGNDVTFHLLRGADHNKEWAALDARGGEIFDVLLTKHKAHPPVVSAAVEEKPVPLPPPPTVAPRPQKSGCSCDAATERASAWPFIALAWITRAAFRRSRERTSRSSPS